jgi:hypothetical protein
MSNAHPFPCDAVVLLDALRVALKSQSLALADLQPMRATGTAHGHVRILPKVAGRSALARVAYAYPDDATAAARLRVQAAAFRQAAASGASPMLHATLDPRRGMPGGALVVDAIDGRAPRLPGELAGMADTLAALHALPAPKAGGPLPRQDNPFLATLEVVERHAPFLDRAVPESGARAEIAEELRLVRGMALALGKRAQPLCFALADTHPGNFVVDAAGKAWFVDLEKAHAGSAAIDLAHATLPTSTRWNPADATVGATLSRADTEAFYRRYLLRIGKARARALGPWLMPMRGLTWLRTTTFMARWRVETTSPRDPSNPGQWSAAGMDPAMRAGSDAGIDHCFRRETIWAIREEWMGRDPLRLDALV